MGFPGGSAGKESACNVGYLNSIPGLGRSLGEGKGYPLTMNKANGGNGIPAELFQILKDDAMKVLALNMPANLENSAVAMGLENVSFHSSPKEKQCQRLLKLPHNCTHLTC